MANKTAKQKNTKVSSSKKILKTTKNFGIKKKLILVGSIAMTMIVSVIVVASIINGKNQQYRQETIDKYNAKAVEVAEQYKLLGTTFADAIKEDNLSDYIASMDDENVAELIAECINVTNDTLYGVWAVQYESPYITESNTIEEINELMNKLNMLEQYAENAINNIGDCRSVVLERKRKEDEEAEAARIKAEQEAAEKAAEEERQRKATMSYNKFSSEIKEGMTIDQIKEVWADWDYRCSISTQSGPYVYYSCKGYSSSWFLSFGFYNGRLTAKSQVGLN